MLDALGFGLSWLLLFAVSALVLSVVMFIDARRWELRLSDCASSGDKFGRGEEIRNGADVGGV